MRGSTHPPGTLTLRRLVRRAAALGLVALVAAAGCATVEPEADSESSAASGAATERYSAARTAFEQGEYERCAQLVRPLAARGHPGAQYTLGYLHFYGMGVSKDPQAAMYWIRSAAGQGYARARQALERIERTDGAPGEATPSPE